MKRMGGSSQQLPDVYGRRSGRRTAVLIGMALLVCALGIGVAIGAGFQRLAPAAGSPPPARTVTAGVPGVGAKGAVAGIPVGYGHSPEGAAQAVGNYLAALGGRLALNPTAAQTALDQVADPGARGPLEAGLAASLQTGEGLWGIDTASQQGKRVVLTQTPIAYRVTSYTDDVATVAVWLVTNVGVEDHQRLVAFFANGAATVVWLNDDWRLRGIANGSAAGDVVPACLQTPTQTGGVPSQLDGFTPYGA
jgi:hypothetical protein